MSRSTQGLPHAVEYLGFADAVAGFAEEGEGLPQITQHAERLALLDDREAQHYQQIAERLREIATQLSDMSTRVHTATGTITDQAAVLASLDGLDEQVAAIAAQLADLHPANSGRASSWSIRAASTSETLSPMGTRAESGRLGRHALS